MTFDPKKYPLAVHVYGEQRSKLTYVFSNNLLPYDYVDMFFRAVAVVEECVDEADRDRVLAAHLLATAPSFSLKHRYKFSCPKELKELIAAVVKGQADHPVLIQGAAVYWIVAEEKSRVTGGASLIRPPHALPKELQEMYAADGGPKGAALQGLAPKLYGLLMAGRGQNIKPAQQVEIRLPAAKGALPS